MQRRDKSAAESFVDGWWKWPRNGSADVPETLTLNIEMIDAEIG